MRPSDVIRTLTSLRPTQRPVALWGAPGVGKSSLLRQAAAQLQMQYLDIRLFLHDTSDFKFPIVSCADKTVDWVQSIFPRDPAWDGLVVLEEFGHAPQALQCVASQVLLERQLGQYRLPERCWVCIAGNRVEDRAGVNRIITPVLNRLIHLDVETSLDDWKAWAVANDIAPEVVGFLNFKPDLLHHFEPSSNPRAFPSPRSWQFCSEVLARTPEDLLHQVLAGTIGDGPAAEFLVFRRLYRELPDVDGLLTNPNGFKVPTDPSVLFALSGALADRARKLDAKTVGNFVQLCLRLPDEFAILTMRDTLSRRPELVAFAGTQLRPFLLQHKDVLTRGRDS